MPLSLFSVPSESDPSEADPSAAEEALEPSVDGEVLHTIDIQLLIYISTKVE